MKKKTAKDVLSWSAFFKLGNHYNSLLSSLRLSCYSSPPQSFNSSSEVTSPRQLSKNIPRPYTRTVHGEWWRHRDKTVDKLPGSLTAVAARVLRNNARPEIVWIWLILHRRRSRVQTSRGIRRPRGHGVGATATRAAYFGLQHSWSRPFDRPSLPVRRAIRYGRPKPARHTYIYTDSVLAYRWPAGRRLRRLLRLRAATRLSSRMPLDERRMRVNLHLSAAVSRRATQTTASD